MSVSQEILVASPRRVLKLFPKKVHFKLFPQNFQKLHKKHSIDLLVQSHPEVTISARMNHRDVIGDVISFKAGTTITMMCNAEGFPKPRVHWRKDGYPIRRRSVHLRVYGGQLKLFRSRKVDAGVYSCHASNKAGNTDKSIRNVFDSLRVSLSHWSIKN